MNIVDKYEPKEFLSITTDAGVILCEKSGGAFLALRFPSDVVRLRELLDKIKVEEK